MPKPLIRQVVPQEIDVSIFEDTQIESNHHNDIPGWSFVNPEGENNEKHYEDLLNEEQQNIQLYYT